MDASDANEAKMYAILIGGGELLNLGGLVAIIEGDSFSVIQWGSRKTSYPWRLADWMEEVKDISFQLDVSFHHIFRKANEMAAGLAKVGVSLDSISFDV